MKIIKKTSTLLITFLIINPLAKAESLLCPQILSNSSYEIPDSMTTVKELIYPEVNRIEAELLQWAKDELVKLENIPSFDPNSEFAERLGITAEDLPITEADEFKESIIPNKDMLTNPLGMHTNEKILKILDKSIFGIKGWGDYMTYPTTDEIEAYNEASELETEDDVIKAQMQIPLMKYLNGNPHHAVVFNPELGILIDATYRQFLINKISQEDFDKLPRIFIGTLSEFRSLVAPFLSNEAVDRMFLSVETDWYGMPPYNLEKPSLLDFESGKATYKDVVPRQSDLDSPDDLAGFADGDQPMEVIVVTPEDEQGLIEDTEEPFDWSGVEVIEAEVIPVDTPFSDTDEEDNAPKKKLLH